MTTFRLAEPRETAALAVFLTRLLRYDRAAVVRLKAHGPALAVFGRPPFDVLAVRTVELAGPAEADATVSAGRLLDGLDEAGGAVPVPEAVTGPPWAGLLPPRAGWRRVAELSPEAVHRAVAEGVAEFRARTEQLGPDQRTRAELDRIAGEIWSRPLPTADGLPLRAVHAAHSLGFLRPLGVASRGSRSAPSPRPAGQADAVVVLSCASWLRVRTAHGSIALRRGAGPGIAVTPLS